MKQSALALLVWTGLALCCGASQAEPQDELLLLGVREQDGSLSTILADRFGLKKLGAGIAVPRTKSWWKIDLLARRQNSFEESILFARDTRKAAKEPPFTFDDSCESKTSEVLLFVGADHLSKEVSSSGVCQSSERPWNSVSLATVSTDGGPSSESVPIERLLQQAAVAAWEKAAKQFRNGQSKKDKACLDEARAEEWAIVRQKGRWVVRGELNYLAESCRGKHAYFEVDSPLPTTLVGESFGTSTWAKTSASEKGLVDVVVSPSSRAVLFVLSDRLELRLDGKPESRLDAVKATIVMARWATGAQAARWREEALRLFADEAAATPSP